MEAELLRGMITDRDTRIANIQRKNKELIVKEERLKDELSDAAETNSSQIITQQTQKTALYHEQQGLLHQLANLHFHLQRQGDSLNEYSMYLQQNGDVSANDSQNVMRLQAQLCKAMHSVSIVDRQHEMVMAQNENLLKLQKEALAKASEEKARIEQSILNDLVVRDTELRGVENKLKDELDGIYKEMNSIRDQMDDSDSEDDEDNDGEPKEDEEEEEEEEELDEEEKAAKEEMMTLLQERKAEIERLEREIEEKEELIEELQMRAGEEPPPEDSPKVSMAARKEVAKEEALPKKEEPPKKEEKKEEPVDEIAARLQEVMASASDAKVDEVDEMDLLKLAQSRLTGGADAGGDDDDDEGEEEDSEDEESEFDESFSERSTKAEEEEYDPTEKKEDPMVES